MLPMQVMIFSIASVYHLFSPRLCVCFVRGLYLRGVSLSFFTCMRNATCLLVRSCSVMYPALISSSSVFDEIMTRPYRSSFVRRNRFWHKPTFDALESLKELCEKHETSLVSASLRWLHHHSALSGNTLPSMQY